MLLTFSLVCLAACLVIAAWQPNARRQLVGGAVLGVPFWLGQIWVTGGLDRFGLNTIDAFLQLVTMFVMVVATSALVAYIFERGLNRWLTPVIHLQRHRLGWLGLGVCTWFVLTASGTPALLAGLVGLLVNTVVVVLIGRFALWWDALVGALGVGVWYALLELALRVPTAGDLSQVIGPALPFGTTIASVPVELVLFFAVLGSLLGPVFAATKLYRAPQARRGHQVASRKVALGGAMVGLIFLGLSWMLSAYYFAPRLVQLSPASGATTVPTNADVVFTFDRPVDREQLAIAWQPDVTGTWIFEMPEQPHHAYHTARWRPDTTWDPGRTYTAQLTGVYSVWGTPGTTTTIRFRTRDMPDVTGVERADQDQSGPFMTPPCAAMVIDLTSAYDPSADFSYRLTPSAAMHLTVTADQHALRLAPDGCLADHTSYHLELFRRQIQRDRATGDIIAADEPMLVYEVLFQTQRPGDGAIATGAGPQVLGVSSALSGLTPLQARKVLPIKLDYQDQPLSCEAAALKMALAGQGVKVTEAQIMKVIGYDPTPHRGTIWGDPDAAFVGNIAGRQNTTGYGVHWRPVARAAKRWRTAWSLSGLTAPALAKEISAGHPVILWGTMGAARSTPWKTPRGKTVAAWKGEHARTVIGFYGPVDAPTHFVLNDPIAGRLVWTRATLERNAATFHASAVVVE